MRLVTYAQDDRQRVGVMLDDAAIMDVNAGLAAYLGEGKAFAVPDMKALLELGDAALRKIHIARDAARARTERGDRPDWLIPLETVTLAAPVPNPQKIVAIGQNYRDHCREQNAPIPERPIIFTKFPTAIIGQGGAITWNPALTQQVDFEAELAVVIGKRARCVRQDEAYDYVAGYLNANDVSARDLQFGDQQWVRGKSLDTFCPLGPYLVTRAEIPDPRALRIRSVLNGRVMQDSNTRNLIFSVPELIEFASAAFTLLPGDILLTGTPPGVGMFRAPKIFMQPGDIITVEVEGLGALTNPVCAWQA